MRRKWRPGLAFVLGGAMCGTLLLSLTGLVAFRFLGPEIGYRNSAVLLAVIITAATAVLGWLLIRLLLRPIFALERFATQVVRNPADPLSPPSRFGTRELGITAQRVIDMAETLRNRETTIRSFSDHVTHELKTPVATLRAATELLKDDDALSAQTLRLVDQIASAGIQMEQQIEAMRQVARARESRHEGSTSLNEVLDALCRDYPNLEIRVDGGDVDIPMASKGLLVVLRQMLGNAREHDAQVVHLSAISDETQVALQVRDDGHGISAGNATRVFDPFFTTKRDQGGTGMGLAIVRNTLRAHGADITLMPVRDAAIFSIRFEVG
ncbi:Osmolarity sensor protein EnvZ [Ruegeria denitrificans]|uniref:histidine kinase n=1 Tax=Ruegeria denitrificans TaxID=1715692 RepID=A0A0P1IEU7_9RHOB|nr:HAMP domain-containing sensor histidine kinase [Ruegeria denitrificans]CUK09158.1 Osmolarity sensor protein EnvZ [Ruegeria denitrificans]